MKLRRIRLELGRTPDFPEGDPNHGYEIVAPLTDDGRFDRAAYSEKPEVCSVVRFRPYEDDVHGVIVKGADGDWVFSYEPGDEDDEAVFRLADHVFREGEYVTVTQDDGQARAFQVVSVDEWHPGRIGAPPGG